MLKKSKRTSGLARGFICKHILKNCMYISKKTVNMNSDSESRGDSGYESELEQQQGSRYDSQLESDSSIFADFSMDRNAYQSYDQFPEHFEHAAVDDCIDNYMFLVDHKYDALNSVVHLSCDHSYEEETATVDDQGLVSKEQGGLLFTSREAFTEEQPGLLKQPDFCHMIHDPIAIYMESYVSDFLNFQVALFHRYSWVSMVL
jgi:hypothetical protein